MFTIPLRTSLCLRGALNLGSTPRSIHHNIDGKLLRHFPRRHPTECLILSLRLDKQTQDRLESISKQLHLAVYPTFDICLYSQLPVGFLDVLIQVLNRVCSRTRPFVLSGETPSLLPIPDRWSPYSGIAPTPIVLGIFDCSALQIFYHNILNKFRGKFEIKELAVKKYIFRPHVKFLPCESSAAAKLAVEKLCKEYPNGIELGLADNVALIRPNGGDRSIDTLRLVKTSHFAQYDPKQQL
jgi:hypothetical protein